MTIQCKNGCGATLQTVGKNEKGYDIWAEVLENGEIKTGKTGVPINHFFACPNKKPYDQKALDKKHADREAGTYYDKRTFGASKESVMGTAAGGKTKDQKIEEMSEKRNAAMDRQTDAILELAKSIIYLADKKHGSDEKFDGNSELDIQRYRDERGDNDNEYTEG